MSHDEPTALFHLRKLRASPPGLAALEERADTFDAALAQFEELLGAAQKVGTASRPLPLFYALSQAGRAIAAAGATEQGAWRLYGHGLKAPVLDGPLLEIEVHVPRWVQTTGRSVSSFQGVAQLFDGQRPRHATQIGEIWTSLAEIAPLLDAREHPGYRRPVRVVPDDPHGYATPLFPWGRVDIAVLGVNVETDVASDALARGILQELRHYRRAGMPKWILHRPQGIGPLTKATLEGYGFCLSIPAAMPNYEGHLATLRRLCLDANGFEAFDLRPNISRANVSRLGRWWMLLFALSMVARYEPAGWARALAMRSSPVAAPLEELLDVAVAALPTIVLEALERTQTQGP